MKINNEVEDEEEIMEVKNQEELDLQNISRAIEEQLPKPIILNDYEKEQEEKAIISYDELIASQNNKGKVINYKEEKEIDGLKVKSFDLDNLTKNEEQPTPKDELQNPILFDYKKEEEFLKTLKKLQQTLN